MSGNPGTLTNRWSARNQVVLFLVLITLAVYGVMLTSGFQVGSYDDDATYINLAHALQSGQGYVDMAWTQPQPHTLYPPVYPLLLTPLLMAFDYEWLLRLNFLPLQLLSLAMILSSLVFLYLALRRLSPHYAEVVTCVAAFSPSIAGTTVQVMSEAPYLFFSMVALYAATVWRPGSNRWLVAASSAAALASVTRVIGVALLASFVLFSWTVGRQSRKAWLTMVALALLPIIGWCIRNYVLGASILGGYKVVFVPGQSSNYGSVVINNLHTIIFSTIPSAILPGLTSPQVTNWLGRRGLSFVPRAIGLAIVLLVVLGYRQQWRAKVAPQELYVPLYIGIVVLTSFALDAGGRYVMPILPFLLLYLFRGTEFVFGRMFPNRAPTTLPVGVVTSCAIGLISLGVFRDIQAVVNPVRQRIPDITQGTTWLRQNTRPQSVVMTRHYRDVYLYAQRKLELFPAQLRSAGELARMLPCAGVDYVLVQPALATGLPFQWDEYTASVVVPALASRPDVYALEFMSADHLSAVYEVKQSKPNECVMDGFRSNS